MNSQLPTPNSQPGTTKDTKRSKCTKKSSLKRTFFAAFGVFAVFAGFVVSSTAQQLLDSVVARVGSSAITQTDVDAAVAFGIVERNDAVKQIVDRRLILAEVARFPPPEPPEAAVVELVARMRAAAGADAAAVMKRTGADDKRLTELARDSLRIQSYIRQRFGSGVRAEEQMARWLTDIRARGDVTVVSSRP